MKVLIDQLTVLCENNDFCLNLDLRREKLLYVIDL